MPKNILNTIVFTNGGNNPFPSTLFDERELCDEFGALDREQFKANQMSLCRYAEGKYEFSIMPDRIVLRSLQDQEVLPSTLIEAAEKVARELDSLKKMITVASLGLNCEATFYEKEVGMEGIALCNAMTKNPITDHLLQGLSIYAGHTALICLSNQVQYTFRIEPEHAVRGQDLFTDVNGHQNIKTGDSLQQKLGAAEEIRWQIEQFHQQVLAIKKEI